MKINRRGTTHNFEKQNLMGLQDRKGIYDLYTCVACGLTGKAYSLTTITVSDRLKSASVSCPKVAGAYEAED